MKYSIFSMGLIIVFAFFSCKKQGEETAIEPDNRRPEISGIDISGKDTKTAVISSGIDARKQADDESSKAKNAGFYETVLLGMAETYEINYDPELLNDYLGTWLLLNEEEKVDASKSCLTIFPEGKWHRFKFEYYSSESTGTVLITKVGIIKLLKDGENFIPYYTVVGKPFVLNDKQTILLDSEGPLGFFQLE